MHLHLLLLLQYVSRLQAGGPKLQRTLAYAVTQLPPEWSWLVARCLEVDPRLRPSAAQLLAQVEERVRLLMALPAYLD